MENYKIKLQTIKAPQKDCVSPVNLTKDTIEQRKDKVLKKMKEKHLDQLLIYGDVEHGSNFEYLIGFFTRFEEALLLINKDGDMKLLLGNKNLNKATKARVEAEGIHVSLFSLPNQPNRKDKNFETILREAGICKEKHVGIIGWKLFTSSIEKNDQLFDVPHYIVQSIIDIVGKEHVSNQTSLFIGEEGIRTTNNSNEIAYYEYGATLASDCILDAMNLIEEGVSELQLGDTLNRYGQHNSIVTIAASGTRYVDGNMYPREKQVNIGDPISLTVGYRGGSSSRAGYAVHDDSELPSSAKNYLDDVAIPYFNAYTDWLETIYVGMSGGELFDRIDKILPREKYGWSLCPGHLTAEEEWMCSPIYENSKEILRSGMILQIDIIPSVTGYNGCCAESTVLLADDYLKEELRQKEKTLWDRMQNRIRYLKEELGINVSDNILPMCSTVAYLRPYLLNKNKALVKERRI